MSCCNNSLLAAGHGKEPLSVSEVLPEATLYSPQFQQAFASEAVEQMSRIFDTLCRIHPQIASIRFNNGEAVRISFSGGGHE